MYVSVRTSWVGVSSQFTQACARAGTSAWVCVSAEEGVFDKSTISVSLAAGMQRSEQETGSRGF